MAVTDYSTTPASNTSISGINIGEGCAPANINNAIRQLMADLKSSTAAKAIGTDIQAHKSYLNGAALTALGGLTPAADRLPYFTGSGAAALATFTAAGRALLDDASPAAQRNTLELTAGALATSNSQTVWNTGTDTAESIISAAKLQAKLSNYRNASMLGWGQSWQDVSASRAQNTPYRNTTGRPIMVSVQNDSATSTSGVQVSTNGTTWITVGTGSYGALQAVIPDDHYYRCQISFSEWRELR